MKHRCRIDLNTVDAVIMTVAIWVLVALAGSMALGWLAQWLRGQP